MERGTDGMKTSAQGSLNRKHKLYTCLPRIYKMTIFITLVTLVLIYSQHGYSFHEKQTTRPAELPRRFFPSHSSVVDYPYGNLMPVIKLLQDEELIFVMYYAPWCAESMAVRGEFIRAAKVLSDAVKFVGVNCWYPIGECHQRMKFLSYPQLFAYHTGVQEGYRFSGIREAEYFVQFAESFLYPLRPIHTEQELDQFCAMQENTVIGHFDFHSSPQPPGPKFHQFYLSALRVTSYDFYQPVRFGVIGSKHLAKAIDLATPDRFLMFRAGNTTLKYPLYYNMTSKNITNWIRYYSVKNFSPWLVPLGMKSLTLSQALQQGPAVLVFAPVNPLLNFNPYLNMMRLAAYEYGNCGNQTDIYPGYVRGMLLSSFNYLIQARTLLNRTFSSNKDTSQGMADPQVPHKCCMSLSYGCCAENEDFVCEYCIHQRSRRKNSGCNIDFSHDLPHDLNLVQMNSCSDFYQFYNINEHHSLCCRHKDVVVSTTLYSKDNAKRSRRVTDPYVAQGESHYLKRQLRKHTLQKTKNLISLDVLSKHLTKMSDIKSVNFTGLQCRTNRTVGFYFMDSVYHSVFAERLSVPVRSKPNQASVILVDLNDESLYVMKEELNYRSLARFVLNYTSAQLSSHRRSDEVTSPSHCDNGNTLCLTEVTTETFQPVVMDTDKDVVLLYYSTWCGFCARVSHVYLAAAQYFSDMKNITFARINADANDLPWQYTMDSYPSILFFPAHRKSESVAFPHDVPKTLPNLVKFISFHANQSIQINTAVNMCTKDCISKNFKRLVLKIAELQASLAQLERREVTLWSQFPTSKQHKDLLRSEGIALRKAQDMKRSKLKRAQTIHHFLKNNDWKKLDKRTFLPFLRMVMSL